MPIDPAVAVGADLGVTKFEWTSTDVLLYHLTLGADSADLAYVLEDRLKVLPTFGVVAPNFHVIEPPAVAFPGIDIDLSKVLHGTQSITVHGPVPASGQGVAQTRIADVWDKGKAAVIVQESTVSTPSGDPLWTTRSGIFARGEGGFGGDRGPSERLPAPEGDPVLEAEVPTLPQQALLYRLCGDRNPLHADPEFAAMAGFERPILHGLCTYGVVCKALVDNLLDGDVARLGSFGTRCAGILFPGETLRVRAWQTDAGYQATATAVERDDAPVLDETVLSLR